MRPFARISRSLEGYPEGLRDNFDSEIVIMELKSGTEK